LGGKSPPIPNDLDFFSKRGFWAVFLDLAPPAVSIDGINVRDAWSTTDPKDEAQGPVDSQGAGATFFPLAALGYSIPKVERNNDKKTNQDKPKTQTDPRHKATGRRKGDRYGADH
jgi:hypothetical protein